MTKAVLTLSGGSLNKTHTRHNVSRVRTQAGVGLTHRDKKGRVSDYLSSPSSFMPSSHPLLFGEFVA